MKKIFWRRLHRALAPMMVLPLILTLVTGVLYQMVDLTGNDEAFDWLLDVHKGEFGPLNLEGIYPFLNATGLLLLVVTGGVMWWSGRRPKPSTTESPKE